MKRNSFFAAMLATAIAFASIAGAAPAFGTGTTAGISLSVEPTVTIYSGTEENTAWYWRVTLEPDNAWDWEHVTWETGDPGVISVTPTDSDPIEKGHFGEFAVISFSKKAGTSTVKVTTDSGLSASCVVEVLAGNKQYHYRVADGEAEIVLYDSSATGKAVIPETVGGCPVTAIGAGAFKWCDGLTSVQLPDSVEIIGDEAFMGCQGITSITMPSGLTQIGTNAFKNCGSLRTVAVPSGVYYIGDTAFQGCVNLTNIQVSGGNAFYKSSGNCLIDTRTRVLIAGCSDSVIPDDGSVTEIGSGAFFNCGGLKSISVPAGVTSVGDEAFCGCGSLAVATLPDSLRSIGNAAFYNCFSLGSIEIPDGVQSVGAWAFSGCSALKSMSIPQSVIGIGQGALSGYTGGMDIEIDQRNPRYYIKGNCVIDSDRCEVIAGRGDSSIPDDNTVFAIGDYAFGWCGELRSISVPDSVRTVGEGAFEGCCNLEVISIPDSVRTIGDYAFEGCSSVKTLTIPESVESIGAWAFENCVSLRDASIKGKVNEIPNGAFSYCGSLSEVSIPDSVRSVGYSAFEECGSLTDVYYAGTAGQADEIDIDDWGNGRLFNAVWHCESEGPLRGDFDGDGKVTDDDAIYLLFHVFFPKNYPMTQSGDVNGDGKVDDDDAIHLLFHVFFPNSYVLE